MSWRGVLGFFHNWQWLIGGILAAVPTFYYGPRKAVETWDWYVARFRDQAILDVMRDRTLLHHKFVHPEDNTNAVIAREGSYSVGDLAHLLDRSHQAIGKSIRRLKRRGTIEQHRGGFRLK